MIKKKEDRGNRRKIRRKRNRKLRYMGEQGQVKKESERQINEEINREK